MKLKSTLKLLFILTSPLTMDDRSALKSLMSYFAWGMNNDLQNNLLGPFQ